MDRSASGVARRLRLAREGSADALGELMETHRNYLRILAASCLRRGLQSKADASDVAQMTLLKVHEGFQQFRGTTEGEWLAWLRTILVRSLADLQRDHTRLRRNVARDRSLEDLVDRSSTMLRELIPAAGPSPSEQAQVREVGALVADALVRLDPEDQEVIALRSFDDLEWSEVGERMDRSPEAARKLWGRALGRVGGLLKERMT